MKVNSKGKLDVKYSLLKPLSQYIEVLAPRYDVINPKIGVKNVQIGVSCNNLDRKIKMKIKLLWGKLFVYETFLSNFWDFDSIWWRHQPKIGSKKGPKPYFMY